MAGVNEADGGWAQTHGATPTTTTDLSLSIDEDLIGDSERNHATEQVGYVVFETSVAFPECFADTDCSDGNDCTANACVDGLCTYPDEPTGTSITNRRDAEKNSSLAR